jgi:hypothetical protein
MPAVNDVGEPCAREPHARFEAAGAGNGADLAKDTEVAQPPGKPAEQRPQALPPASHRASPRPYVILGWWPEAAARSRFLVSGQRFGPAVAPGVRGFHGPAGVLSWSLGCFRLVSRVRGPGAVRFRR